MTQMRASSFSALGCCPFKVCSTSISDKFFLGSPSRISQMSSSVIIVWPMIKSCVSLFLYYFDHLPVTEKSASPRGFWRSTINVESFCATFCPSGLVVRCPPWPDTCYWQMLSPQYGGGRLFGAPNDFFTKKAVTRKRKGKKSIPKCIMDSLVLW